MLHLRMDLGVVPERELRQLTSSFAAVIMTPVISCFYSRFSDFLTFFKAVIFVKNAMTPFRMITIRRAFHFLQLNYVKIHK